MKTTPIHEVFEKRAQGIIHMLRMVIPAFQGATSGEPLTVEQTSNDDGVTLRFNMVRHRHVGGHWRHGFVEFGNITPLDPKAVTFGPETILSSEQIGSNEQTVDNRDGDGDVEVDFNDLFSHESGDEKTTDKSVGSSLSISISSEQDVEGVAKFGESIESEVHAEVSESETKSETTTHEEGGDEATIVKPGHCKIITESRTRADVRQEVSARGDFSFYLIAGAYVTGIKHHHQEHRWDSWQQFVDVINGDAPDNWALADELKKHRVFSADRWALAPLNAPLRYAVTFEGRVIRKYSVRDCG